MVVTSRAYDLGEAPGIYLEELDPGHLGAAFLPLQQPVVFSGLEVLDVLFLAAV